MTYFVGKHDEFEVVSIFRDSFLLFFAGTRACVQNHKPLGESSMCVARIIAELTNFSTKKLCKIFTVQKLKRCASSTIYCEFKSGVVFLTNPTI